MIWKALVLSRLICHSAIWSAMTAKARQQMETAFHAGLRIIDGPPSFAQLATQSHTDQTTRAALAILSLQVIVATRRLGLFRRVLASGCPWFLGFIFEARTTPRTWGARLRADTEWLQAREPGMFMPLIPFLSAGAKLPCPTLTQYRYARRNPPASYKRGPCPARQVPTRSIQHPWDPSRTQRLS